MYQEHEGPGPEDMGLDNNPEDNEASRESSVVNGIEIKLSFIDGNYEIYFPQIDPSSDEAESLSIYDQIIPLGPDREVAKENFDRAVKLAESGKNVCEIYQRINF